MKRRGFLAAISGTAALLAGCSGNNDVLVSGSTSQIREWFQELEKGEVYELEVNHIDGYYAIGTVQRQVDSGLEKIIEIEVEDEGTRSEEFEVPETMEYHIAISTDSRASLTLREV